MRRSLVYSPNLQLLTPKLAKKPTAKNAETEMPIYSPAETTI
jgi:hypothetical protein